MIPFFGPFISWAPPVIVALALQPESLIPTVILMGIGWFFVMNVLQPRIMQGAVGIHPIVVLGSVLIGGRIAGIPGAIFGIPIAAVVSAFFFQFLHRTSGDRTVTGRAARRLSERDGRPVRIPREPTPGSATDIDEAEPGPDPHMTDDERGDGPGAGDTPDMTRERARTERRDLDKERGEPLAGGAARGGAARGGPRALRTSARPLGEWESRPRILITNDDGVESRGLLALKQALEPMGDVTVVAPDTNQSAVGHQKTLMRPLRIRERTLADGSLAFSVDGSPTDAVSVAFLGYFGHGFDLVASGINYGANLGDDITYSGTVSAAMEAVINSCPAFAISQEYYEHPDFSLAGRAAAAVALNILEHGLSPGELINVNVPAIPVGDDAEFEVTRLGKRIYQDQLVARKDPRGIPYFWIGGPPPSGLAVEGTDFHAVVNRRIAVTPIHLDLTGRRLLKRLRTWDWSLPQDAAGSDAQRVSVADSGDAPTESVETAAVAGAEAAEIDAAEVAKVESGAPTNEPDAAAIAPPTQRSPAGT